MYEAGVGDVEWLCVLIKFTAFDIVIVFVINPQFVLTPGEAASLGPPSRFVKRNYTAPGVLALCPQPPHEYRSPSSIQWSYDVVAAADNDDDDDDLM